MLPLQPHMRSAPLIFLFVFFSLGSLAQDKGGLPPTPKTMPRKDGVVMNDNIIAGKTKRYHWHSDYALFSIDMPEKRGSTVDVSLNGKNLLKRYEAMYPKMKARKLMLQKGTNYLVIGTNKSSKVDSFALNLSLGEVGADYDIRAQFKKGLKDTMIIIRH